jgi:hypothetical protein
MKSEHNKSKMCASTNALRNNKWNLIQEKREREEKCQQCDAIRVHACSNTHTFINVSLNAKKNRRRKRANLASYFSHGSHTFRAANLMNENDYE